MLARFLQFVPITMELVAPIKSQKLYYHSPLCWRELAARAYNIWSL